MTNESDLIDRTNDATDGADKSDPAHRDWIPTCWSDEARGIPGAYRFGDRVKPWNWLELDANEAEKLWSLLFGFVAFFNARYGEKMANRIPPCWVEHGPIVEELTTLMFARWHAFESPHGSVGGAQYWHSYTLPAFYSRISEWLGDDLLSCQQGRHRDSKQAEFETNTAWAARNELVWIMDVALRESAVDDPTREVVRGPHGVEIPYLDGPSATRPLKRPAPKT